MISSITRLGAAFLWVLAVGASLDRLHGQVSFEINDVRYQEIGSARTAHSRTIQYSSQSEVGISAESDSQAAEDAFLDRYVEIAGGMHWNAAVEGADSEPIWMETHLEWETLPTGGAMVIEAPRLAWLSPRLDGTPMMVIKPETEGEPILAFSFHGLAYVHRVTGELVWIGLAKSSRLQVDGIRGYYTDAITNLSATWMVEHKFSGIGAGLILHEKPAPPTEYGFSSNFDVDLVVVSEIIGLDDDSKVRFRQKGSAPGQVIGIGQLRSTGMGHRPIDFKDEIHKGAHRLDRGYAFLLEDRDLGLGMDTIHIQKSLDENAPEAMEIEVKTSLVRTDDQRLLLYESIPFGLLREQMWAQSLPQADGPIVVDSGISNVTDPDLPEKETDQAPEIQPEIIVTRLQETRVNRRLEPVQMAASGAMPVNRPVQVASSGMDAPWKKGLYIDYETVSASTTNRLEFLAGKTYYISSPISISEELVIEGGAVVKLSGSGRITVLSGASVQTPDQAYTPATFVSRNCNDIGSTVVGSTGTPARGDYQRALVLYNEEGGVIRNLRAAHAWQAFELEAGAWQLDNIVLRDNYCSLAVMEEARAQLRNSLVETGKYWAFRLFVDNGTAGANAPDSDEYQLRTEQVTVLGSNNYILRYDWTGTGSGYTTFSAVNSVFGAPNGSFCSRSSSSLTWRDEFKNCAFRSSSNPPANMREDCITLTETTGNYFSAHATGNYYLVPTIGGLPNPMIDAGMTTPAMKELLAGKSALAPADIGSSWTTAGRLAAAVADGDGNDALDLGYHYPAVAGAVGVGGLSVEADLEVRPGQIIATDNTIQVANGGRMRLSGGAADPAVIVPCWQISDELVGYRPGESADRWTGLWVQSSAANGNILENTVINGFWRGAILDPRRMTRTRDNHFYAFEVGLYPWSADEGAVGYDGNLYIDNCLFHGMGSSAVGIYTLQSDASLRCATFAWFENQAVYPGGAGSIALSNSLLADCYMPLFADPNRLSLSYCGFYRTTISQVATNARSCGVSPFASGPLGGFYLNDEVGGGNLLRGNPDSTRGGSGTAAANGVYHGTVDPAAAVGEQNGEVSIGFHYPPTPLPDADLDGLADTDEDRDGDGFLDPGETDWLDSDTDHDLFSDLEEYEMGTDPLSAAENPGSLAIGDTQNQANPFRRATGLRVYHSGGDPNDLQNWTYQESIEIGAQAGVSEVFLLLRARFPRHYAASGPSQGVWVSGESPSAQRMIINESLITGPDPYLSLYGSQYIIIVPKGGANDDLGETITRTILVKVPFEDQIILSLTGDPTYSTGTYVEVLQAWPNMKCDDEYDPQKVDFNLDAPDFHWVTGEAIQNCCNQTLKNGMCLSCARTVGGANVALDNGLEVSFNAGGSWDSGAPAKIVFKLNSLEGILPELTPDVCYTIRNVRDEVERNPQTRVLHQLRTNEALVDVTATGANGYSMYFYPMTTDRLYDSPPFQVDPAIDPWLVRWNLSLSTSTGDLTLTRSTCLSTGGCVNGSTSIVSKDYVFSYDAAGDEWQLTTDAGTQQEHRTTETSVSNGLFRVVTETKEFPNDSTQPPTPLVERTYKTFPWGEELIKEVVDPNGEALTTTWEFHLSGPGYGALKKTTFPDGMWMAYGYEAEDGGRLSSLTTPWTDGQLEQVIEYDYEPLDASVETVVPADDARPRTMIKSLGGIPVEATLYAYSATRKIEKRSPNPQNPLWSDPDNVVTEWAYYPANAQGEGAAELKSVLRPDGQVSAIGFLSGPINTLVSSSRYPSLTSEPGIRRMNFHGSEAIDPSKDIRLHQNQSAVDVTVHNLQGKELIHEIFVFTGNTRDFDIDNFDAADGGQTEFSRMGWQRTEYDALGRWIMKSYDDGSSETQTWIADGSCCNGKDYTDRQGVTTQFRYNTQGKLISKTRLGIGAASIGNTPYSAIGQLTETFSYNAAGEMIEHTADDGANQLTTTWNFDADGQLVSSVDPAGLTTSFQSGTDIWGRRFEEQILPGNAVIRRTFYLDGQEASETGSGVVNRYVEHGVDAASGDIFMRETHGAPDSADIKTVYQDALGRVSRMEKPSFGGGAPTLETYEYDSAGRTMRISRSGAADTYYTYGPLGNTRWEGQDLDGVAGLQASSAEDKITENTWGYEKISTTVDGIADEGWFLFSKTSSYVTPNSSSRLDLGTSYARVTLGGTFLPPTRRLEARTVTAVGGVIDTTTRNLLTAHLTSKRIDHIDTGQSEFKEFRAGLQQRIVSKTGDETRIEYDAHGRERYRIQVMDPSNASDDSITETVYAADSSLVAVKREGLDATRSPATALSMATYAYDASGRISQTTFMDGRSIRNEYNGLGQKTRIWGDATKPVSYSYDEWGRRVSQKTYRGGSNWNASSWGLITTGIADETSWIYDEATGLLVQKIDDDGVGYSLDYFPNGQPRRRQWARGSYMDFEYYGAYYGGPAGEPDSAELKSVDYSDDTPDVGYQYLARTRMPYRITDQVGVRTFSYDINRGMLFSKEEIQAGGLFAKKIELIPQYTVSGRDGGLEIRQNGLSSPPLYKVEKSYQIGTAQTDRLQKMIVNGNTASAFEFAYLNGTGLINSISIGTFSRNMTYSTPSERRMFLTKIDNRINGSSLASFAYRYNSRYQRESVVETGTAFGSPGFHNRYAYNGHGELSTSDRFASIDPLVQPAPAAYRQGNEYRSYLYDNIGNRDEVREKYPPAQVVTDYTADNLNQYDAGYNPAAYDYDLDGNLISDGKLKYQYDAQNRLKSVSPENPVGGDRKLVFLYDYLGRRVARQEWVYLNSTELQKVESRRFVYEGWRPVLELDGMNLDALIAKYWWGPKMDGTTDSEAMPGTLYACQRTDAGTSDIIAFAYDGNGNVSNLVQMTPNGPQPVAHYRYDPYGNQLTTQAPGSIGDKNRFRFSTKYWEFELLHNDTDPSLDAYANLYDYGYRFYSPLQGRWLTRDPLEEMAGPNLYNFVGNDPIGRIDPSGMSTYLAFVLGPDVIGSTVDYYILSGYSLFDPELVRSIEYRIKRYFFAEKYVRCENVFISIASNHPYRMIDEEKLHEIVQTSTFQQSDLRFMIFTQAELPEGGYGIILFSHREFCGGFFGIGGKSRLLGKSANLLDFVSLDDIVMPDFWDNSCCTNKDTSAGIAKEIQGMAEPINNRKIAYMIGDIIYGACCLELTKDELFEYFEKTIPVVGSRIREFSNM